jgi:hypothetical protein
MVLNEAESVQYGLFDISVLHEMAVMTVEVFVQYEKISSSWFF